MIFDNIQIRPFRLKDLNSLIEYFNNLSSESKSRFGPHPFTKVAVLKLASQTEVYKMYIAINLDNSEIIAYTIIKFGWINFDTDRLRTYGLVENKLSNCTLAPSVADALQSKGVGSHMLVYVINDLQQNHKIQRVILWGGVQSGNIKAIKLYEKFGFKVLGQFEHKGNNIDMILDLM